MRGTLWIACLSLAALAGIPLNAADSEKEAALTTGSLAGGAEISMDAEAGGGGYRFSIAHGESEVPVVVVGGTPYQMGWHLGHLLKKEMAQFLPLTVAGFKLHLQVSDEELDRVWASTSAYTDPRFLQELIGLSDGSGLPIRTLQQAHCLPLLTPYSCSSVAAWGEASADGHLYQTRDLDWSLEAGAHRFPALVVYLPQDGLAHVLPTFAGIIGANCGMSASGIVLAEMGDSSAKEMPYHIRAPHFTTWFRTVLYDAESLTGALDIFRAQPMTKRYHYVFGDGGTEKRAVKIVADSRESGSKRVQVWSDNDPEDELAPNVMPDVVYNDEGRGAFPTIQSEYGKLDAERMQKLACAIPIKGSNVMNAVFDATALRVWVAYAGLSEEAYERKFVFLDLKKLDGDGDGRPDLEEGSKPGGEKGLPAFLDAAR